MPPDVLVIGGGFAGLAAAVRLASRKVSLTVLEQRPRLGGRAYSFVDEVTGDEVDNGQHLFLGCFHETKDFLRVIGTESQLRFQERFRLVFRDSRGRAATLSCPALPAPLHLLWGLLRHPWLSLGDVAAARHILRDLRQPAGTVARLSVADWLRLRRQPEALCQALWFPLATSALNEAPDEASAALFVKALQETFLGGQDRACIGLARVGLSRLYADAATRFISDRGGEVYCNQAVEELEGGAQGITGVRLRTGERLRANTYVVAVPPPALIKLLPPGLARRPVFQGLTRLRSSPILSLHLWFNRPLTDEAMIGLVGTQLQWCFNKSRITGEGPSRLAAVTLVISAARQFMDWPKEELVRMALDDLRKVLPESQGARLLHSLVIQEKQATFSMPAASQWHIEGLPGLRRPLPNLILAGDWTATAWPPTIESAVRSGHRAADLVCQL